MAMKDYNQQLEDSIKVQYEVMRLHAFLTLKTDAIKKPQDLLKFHWDKEITDEFDISKYANVDWDRINKLDDMQGEESDFNVDQFA